MVFGKFAGTIISLNHPILISYYKLFLEVHKVYNFIVKELTRQRNDIRI